MKRTHDLIGKAIVHTATGDTLATVHDVLFDAHAHQIIALMIQTGGWHRQAQVVPWRCVTTFGDVVLVQGEYPVIKAADEAELGDALQTDVRISGTPIVDDSGVRLGTAGDLFIDDTGKVVGMEVKQGLLTLSATKFLPADHMRAVGKDAVIVDAGKLQPLSVAINDQSTGQTPATP